MRRFKRILVAIRDPGQRTQRALRKAVQIAGDGARIELFHAIAEPLYIDVSVRGAQTLEQAYAALREASLRRLERHAAPLRERGLKVTCEALSDNPPAEAIVREATRIDADLVVVDSRASHTAPWLLRYTDWELLRLCPVPVLMVKDSRAYEAPVVLAALDPLHAAEKPAAVDAGILAAAAALRASLGGELHVVHAYSVSAQGLSSKQMSEPGFTLDLQKHAREGAQSAVDRQLARSKLRDVPTHLVPLHAVNAIPQVARETGARIVVMGAISRSGLKRILIGSTAEAILDELRSDLLIVKPRGFAARVPVRRRGPDYITRDR